MKRVYLITGASSDIGVHFFKRLVQKSRQTSEKCHVFAQYRTSDEQLCIALDGQEYVSLDCYRCDLSNIDDLQAWIGHLREQNVTPTHILHLAAPRFSYMRLKELNWERCQQGLDIAVRSFAFLLQEFLPKMAKARYGRIAAMLTAYTIGTPPKYMCDYVTAKYALLGLVRAAASEYAEKGITINALSPNMMETKFLSNIDARSIEMNAQNSVMRRNVSLDETCASLEYLLADETSYMQGVNLNLSGGDRM